MRWLYLIAAAISLTVGLRCIEEYDRGLGPMRIEARLEWTRDEMETISRYLRQYRRVHGSYPSNDKGLLALDALARDNKWAEMGRPFGAPAFICRVRPSGILSPWGEPIIYENRRGIDPAAFAFSGVNSDPGRRYSHRVDDGVYLWSVAAKDAYGELNRGRRNVKIATACVAAGFVALLVLHVRRTLRDVGRLSTGWKRAVRLALSFLGSGALFTVTVLMTYAVSVRSCYAWSSLATRSPELTKDYTAILAKYRDNGIISRDAYRKIIKGLKADQEGR